MNTKTTFIAIEIIIMCLTMNWLFDIATPAINNISATPEKQALYELSKTLNGVSSATLAFANSTTAFKPYKQVCKTSIDPQVIANCSKIAFLVNS